MSEGLVDLDAAIGRLDPKSTENHEAARAENHALWLEGIFFEDLLHLLSPANVSLGTAVGLIGQELRPAMEFEAPVHESSGSWITIALEFGIDPPRRLEGRSRLRLLHCGVDLSF